MLNRLIRPFSRQITKIPFMKQKNAVPRLLLAIPTVSLGFMLYNNKFYAENNYFEVTIPADLKEGEMKEVQVGPTKDDLVLVANIAGKYYCVQNSCPHFGAPMGKGVLFGDKVICPYHNAAFSVIDGIPEGGPVFNGLTSYDIAEKDGILHIKVQKDKLNKAMTVPMATRGNDSRKFVIVGGGPAALSCAETLRQSGFEGEIMMISDENHLPYDRTLLSKWITGNAPEKIAVRNKDFFEKFGITVMNGEKVTEIDFQKNSLKTSKDSNVTYDRF